MQKTRSRQARITSKHHLKRHSPFNVIYNRKEFHHDTTH
jgi:hypothetical protein